MSIPNEALQQMLQEINQKKVFAEQQLLLIRQQKAARTREERMLQLTSSEVAGLPGGTNVYEGVGKMFVATPIPDVQSRLKSESEALAKELANLTKKEEFMEKTFANSKEALEQVLKGGA